MAVVLLDYTLRQQYSAEFIRMLFSYNSELIVIVIGNGLHEQDIIPCLLAGAKGYQEIDVLQTYVKKNDGSDSGRRSLGIKATSWAIDYLCFTTFYS